MRGQSRARSSVALALVAGLLLPSPGVLRAQAPAVPRARPAPATATTASTPPKSAPAVAKAAPPAAALPDADGGWPRAYSTPSGGRLLLYQPQIASWEGQKKMVAYGAVSYQPKGAEKPALGSIKIEATTGVSLEERLVRFSPLQVSEAKFATLDRDQTREVVGTITSGIPETERVIALDRVLAHLDTSKIIPRNVEGVKAEPPPIFSSTTPAVLVILDGDPIWSPIKDNDLKYAVNTNWDLFEHGPTKTYYLRHNQSWLQADGGQGPLGACRHAPGQLLEAAT